MKRFALVLLIGAGFYACSPKSAEVEEPITKEQLLENAWQEYANLNFAVSKSLFDSYTQLDPFDPEGYYGLTLSYSSLGLRDRAASAGIIGIFVEGSPYNNEIFIDTVTATLTDTIVTSCQRKFDPPRRIVCEGYYIYDMSKLTHQLVRIELFNINRVPIDIVDFGQNFIVAEFIHTVLMNNTDSILSSTLPHAGDTVLYSAEVVNMDSASSVVWNTIVAIANAYTLMEDYASGIQYGYLAKFIPSYGTLPSRVVKSFDRNDMLLIMAKNFYNKSLWYSLANVLHDIDNTWPYASWGDNRKEDIRWALNNTDAIKAKYYSILGGD